MLASGAYFVLGGLAAITAGPRAALLEGSRTFIAVGVRAALQLLLSLLLSVALYAALYAALVPEIGMEHALHFGLCQPSARGSPTAGAPAPSVRVAKLMFAKDAESLFAQPATAQAASTDGLATVPSLARAYDYTVGVCMRLPESPPNIDAGTFVAAIRVVSESNRTLLSTTRPVVLRYRSPQLKWMWTMFYALPLLLGGMDESQRHCVEEAFTNDRHEPASRVTIALVSHSACALQLYDASIYFGAQLGSVTHAMRTYFLASATVGIGCLMALHLLVLMLFELRPASGAGDNAVGGTRSTDRPEAQAVRESYTARRGGGAGAAAAAAAAVDEHGAGAYPASPPEGMWRGFSDDDYGEQSMQSSGRYASGCYGGTRYHQSAPREEAPELAACTGGYRRTGSSVHGTAARDDALYSAEADYEYERSYEKGESGDDGDERDNGDSASLDSHEQQLYLSRSRLGRVTDARSPEIRQRNARPHDS